MNLHAWARYPRTAHEFTLLGSQSGRSTAVRFFWCTLVSATGASAAGNIAHAMLAEPHHAVIAAAAAVGPPADLLRATHVIALFVRARTPRWAHWRALVTAAALAGRAVRL